MLTKMGSKIVYIAGLGHSGSTILDMSLGTLPGVVGLGELKSIMDERSRDRHFTSVCSCGKHAKDCVVWKEVHGVLKGLNSDSEKLEAMLELLKRNFGDCVTMVDSSKNSYAYLKYLSEKHDLKVIYLTRDVRSWSYTRHLATRKPVVYYFLRWYLENLKLRLRIKKMGIKPWYVGYEEMALYPEHVLPTIAKHLGLEYSESMLSLDETNSHIISGNVARVDKIKRLNWKYDARWMVSRRIMFLSPLFLLVQKMNRKLVYSMVHNNSIRDFYLFGTRRRDEISKTHN
ncbi:MAG: hypothetical protein U9Q98_10355 [Bacteroidota bacterium]|nr:hypothetical protein [Bacteroidota bacterium]